MSEQGRPENTRARLAAQWFAARGRGVMSLEERARFEAWREDAANEATLCAMDHAWDTLAPLAGEFTPERAEYGEIVRRKVIMAACAVSLMLSTLFYTSGPFWTTLDWVSR